MLATPLRPSNRDPVAKARQVFPGQSAPRVLGVRHPLFRDAMVLVRGQPLFLAAALLQQELGRLRAFGLLALAQLRLALAASITVTARIGLAVRIGRHIHNPQIDPCPAPTEVSREMNRSIAS